MSVVRPYYSIDIVLVYYVFVYETDTDRKIRRYLFTSSPLLQ